MVQLKDVGSKETLKKNKNDIPTKNKNNVDTLPLVGRSFFN